MRRRTEGNRKISDVDDTEPQFIQQTTWAPQRNNPKKIINCLRPLLDSLILFYNYCSSHKGAADKSNVNNVEQFLSEHGGSLLRVHEVTLEIMLNGNNKWEWKDWLRMGKLSTTTFWPNPYASSSSTKKNWLAEFLSSFLLLYQWCFLCVVTLSNLNSLNFLVFPRWTWCKKMEKELHWNSIREEYAIRINLRFN